MTRLLLDTNVLVSAILFAGKPARLVNAAREGTFTAVVSLHILGELIEVLQRPAFGYERDHAEAFAEEIAVWAEVWPVEHAQTGDCRDPNDEPILAAAVLADVDYIVTGDGDLLTLASAPVAVITIDAALGLLGA